MQAHGLDHLIVDADSFKHNPVQEKEETGWGYFFKGLGVTGDLINAANPIDRAENTWNYLKSWNGTTIKVPLSTLQDNARIMQELTDTNMDIFDRVYNSLVNLRENGQWQGTSLQAIMLSTEANKRKFADTITEMKSLAKFLDDFTTDIADKDTQIKNQINAV